MTVNFHASNPRKVKYYAGQSRKPRARKPRVKRAPLVIDPALLAEAQAEALANLDRRPLDRWANRDRTVPASRWSGKPLSRELEAALTEAP
jgi:hypothetical protein